MSTATATKHSCHGATAVDAPAGARTIVLVGNPNVGKSLFFNAFTGLYVDVSNFPGTTVAVSSGHMGEDVVLDTPGIYGVSSFNDEETVARDIVIEADVIVNVVDAVHLERDLFLTQQVIDMGIPVVVALNMIDEAEAKGVVVDAERALPRGSACRWCPRWRSSARASTRCGTPSTRPSPGVSDPVLQERLTALLDRVGTRPEALLVLEGDPVVSERHGVEPAGLRDDVYMDRRRRVNDVVAARRHPAAARPGPAHAPRPRPDPAAHRHPRAGADAVPHVRGHRRVRGRQGRGLHRGHPHAGLRRALPARPRRARDRRLRTRLRDPRRRVRRAHHDGHLHLRAAAAAGRRLLPAPARTLEDSGYLPRIAALCPTGS